MSLSKVDEGKCAFSNICVGSIFQGRTLVELCQFLVKGAALCGQKLRIRIHKSYTADLLCCFVDSCHCSFRIYLFGEEELKFIVRIALLGHTGHEVVPEMLVAYMSMNCGLDDGEIELATTLFNCDIPLAFVEKSIRSKRIRDGKTHNIVIPVMRRHLRDMQHAILREKSSDPKSPGEDFQAAINLLQSMGAEDPDFYSKIFICEKTKQLLGVFWIFGQFRRIGRVFHDILYVDTTFLTNEYDFPLLIVTCIDGENRSFPAACCLLADSTTERFSMILEAVKSGLGIGEDEAPVVVSDGERALITAISSTFPLSHLLLCTFHITFNLKKKALSLLRGKMKEFLSSWNEVIRARCASEYDAMWAKLKKLIPVSLENEHIHRVDDDDTSIIDEDMHNFSDYLLRLHGKRKHWAYYETQLQFTGGSGTNNRAESMNAAWRRRVCPGTTSFSALIRESQNLLLDYEWSQKQRDLLQLFKRSPPKFIPFGDLRISGFAKAALSIECARCLSYVCKEGTVVTVDRDSKRLVCVVEHREGAKKKHAISFICRTNYLPKMEDAYCDCLYMTSRGLPCRHILSAVIKFGTTFPFGSIHCRWRLPSYPIVAYETRARLHVASEIELLQSVTSGNGPDKTLAIEVERLERDNQKFSLWRQIRDLLRTANEGELSKVLDYCQLLLTQNIPNADAYVSSAVLTSAVSVTSTESIISIIPPDRIVSCPVAKRHRSFAETSRKRRLCPKCHIPGHYQKNCRNSPCTGSCGHPEFHT